MDNPHDRKIIYLLEHKVNKTICDRCRIARLRKYYPTNPFESEIIKELVQGKYIHIDAPDSTLNSDGSWSIGEKKDYTTTKAGIKYIKTLQNYSEIRGIQKDWIYTVGIIIAAIAGSITIVQFIIDTFCA